MLYNWPRQSTMTAVSAGNVAVRCSVLQYVAVCCSKPRVLQCVTVEE